MMTTEEVVKLIESGDRIWIGNTCDVPYNQLDALADRYEELEDVVTFSNLFAKPLKMLTDAKYGKAFHHIYIVRIAWSDYARPGAHPSQGFQRGHKRLYPLAWHHTAIKHGYLRPRLRQRRITLPRHIDTAVQSMHTVCRNR